MKHESITPPPSSSASQQNGPRWTPHKMADFLRALAATHSVSDAAQSVGMSRQSAYRLRSRVKGMAFDIAWDQAFTQSYCNLPYAALERAINGTEVQHFYKGELLATTRRYDERLTVALLKLISGPNGLAIGPPPGVALQRGARFKALLASIEADGELAVDPAEEDAFEAISGADSAAVSPADEARILSELRAFGRKRRG